ncbi:hypothetical protein BGZ60DRAFT_529945 [Tricladium varicosporioides]|nr:hypothetical protein BGZ60DRAFT_529945 [Hymenoscyphus varicosporioides]
MSDYFIFVLFISIVHGATSFNAVDEAFDLRDRSLSTYGGFALAADPCPAELSGTCPSSSGKCCLQNTVCKLVATAEGYVCCLSSDSCIPAVKAAPDCALDTWVL